MENIDIIQNKLMEELDRLCKDGVDSLEVARSNAISNTALTYIKAENLKIRVEETKAKVREEMK